MALNDSLKEKLDRWATLYATITTIPILGLFIKMAFDKITEHGAKKIQKRVEKILGFNVEDAKKDISDEIFYGIAVNALSEDDAKEIDAFEERLRREDCCKAEAFVLFTAKIVRTFEREIKETTNPEKGKFGPRTEQVYKKLEEGIEHAKRFLLALLRNKNADAEVTFTARVAFLQGKNVFSLIKEKKESPLKRFADFLKKKDTEEMGKVNQSASATIIGTQSYKDSAYARLEAAKNRANARRKV